MTAVIGTIKQITVTFREDDVFEGSLPRECWENAAVEDFEVESVEDAISLLTGGGFSFAATGTDWAALPDGSFISDYAQGILRAPTAHLEGFSPADVRAIIEAVG